MFCHNCGAEMKEGALFCPKCGTKQRSQEQEDFQTVQPQEGGQPAGDSKFSGKTMRLLGIFAGAAVILAGTAAGVFFLKGGNKPGQAVEATEQEPQEPLYCIEDVAVIDTGAKNHTPGTKQQGMKWDSSLFYWLEDASEDVNDGNIAKCRLSKTLLRDADTRNLNQYEIYSNPESGEVYKIVSIKGLENGLELVDYYYKDGRLNFAFRRQDSVYTPTYATIGKVGERYYFAEDVMVRWRLIQVPDEIQEHTLAMEDTWYPQTDYFTENDEARALYDSREVEMLNAACNVYDAVTGNKNEGRVKGFLRDTTGKGIAGKTVGFYRDSDGALLYETETDEQGMFAAFVYLDDTACTLKVKGDGEYKEESVQGIQFAASSVTYDYDITLHKEGGDEYPVVLHAYSAVDVIMQENTVAQGNDAAQENAAQENPVQEASAASGNMLQTVTAYVREGEGNRTGEVILETSTQNGEISMNLPSGIYTVQLHVDGYMDIYVKIEVEEETAPRDVYVMPQLNEGQTGVVLTWDGEETDLDLTLFTPYQAENGDMAHIGGNVKEDGHGNVLVSDNKSRCEAMYVNSGEPGSYKLYVNNYTDSLAGNYASDALGRINVHIYIYNSSGFVAEYTVPLDQTGVVWEVLELNGDTLTPAQRIYSEVSGKAWWTEDKDKNKKARKAFYDVLINGVEPEGDYDKSVFAFIREEAAGVSASSGSTFLLKDIDGDGVEELFFSSGEDSIKTVDDFGESGGSATISYALRYKETGVEVMFFHTVDYSNGEFLLDNGQVVTMSTGGTSGQDMIPEESRWKNSTEEIWFGRNIYGIYEDWAEFRGEWTDGKERTYSEFSYSDDLGTEYFIDDHLVSKEEWRNGIQTDIINNLIPEEQYYELNFENVQKVLGN